MDTFFHGCTPYGVRTFDHRHYVAASASGPRSTIPREYPFAHQVFAVKTYFPFWACQFPLPLEPGLQAPTCGRSALGDRPRGELVTRRCIPCMECNGMIYPGLLVSAAPILREAPRCALRLQSCLFANSGAVQDSIHRTSRSCLEHTSTLAARFLALLG